MFKPVIHNLSSQNNMNALLPRDEWFSRTIPPKAQDRLSSWNCMNSESQRNSEIFLCILDFF